MLETFLINWQTRRSCVIGMCLLISFSTVTKGPHSHKHQKADVMVF